MLPKVNWRGTVREWMSAMVAMLSAATRTTVGTWTGIAYFRLRRGLRWAKRSLMDGRPSADWASNS